MLTQERLVEIHVLETQGLSIRAIGRKLGVSRNTVRRYLRDRCLKPQYPCREVKPTKLDPFKGYILRRIDAAKPHWIPATVMLVEIKARGYEGGYSQLKCFLRPFKVKCHDPVVRFETLPGKQMQVDFTNISRGGCRMKGFVATLGFSRSSYVVFSEQERQEDWFSGIEESFYHFGGVPKEVLFDNAKAIVLERDAYGPGHHRWNPKLLELSKKYGFALKLCRPYRAKTKGKVERFNRYLKESFITPLAATMAQAGLRFDVAVANAHIGPWLMQVADQRIHGTTGQKPSVLLDQERHEFLPLPLQSVACATPMDAMSPMPLESFQHPLSTYDRLLEPRL